MQILQMSVHMFACALVFELASESCKYELEMFTGKLEKWQNV